MTTPPRLARWLIERALPPDVRDDVSGDLIEMYRRHQEARGTASARWWYWRQTVPFARHFIGERARGWRRRVDLSSGFSWIDVRLALRMLVRYPGLAAVSVVGLAVGIAIATAAFTVTAGLFNPRLPFDEADAIVALQNWDVSTNNGERRVMRDFAAWRAELRSVQDLGAFRTVGRNLVAEGAQPEPVSVAEMTASGFRVTRVHPQLGRYLLDEDAAPDAPAVVVIGDDVWRRRFAGDPTVIGREIQLGATRYTIVGVMPPGFAFPINHSYWIPWRIHPERYAPRTGPGLDVFARLAPGTSIDTASAELAALGQRLAAESPATHQHLRSRLLPYTYPHTDMDDPDGALVIHAIRSAVIMLLVVVCVNVAILVYARTATRQGEIAVRSALGASRRRIVSQLFLEALVLAGVAAVAGIGLVAAGLGQLKAAALLVAGPMPFWMDFRVSTATVIDVAGLTVLASLIVGVLPALKATGARVQAGLQGLSAGSGSRMQMGRLWTALIVGQVAIAVGLLPPTFVQAWDALKFRTGAPGFASGEFLTADVALDRADAVTEHDTREFRSRYAARLSELERRLESEGVVVATTFSLTQPGGELAAVLEVEGMAAPADRVNYNIVGGSREGHFVRFNRIAADFLRTFDIAVLTGRGFDESDARPSADQVLVDRTFVQRLFAGENALGRRVRYVGISREAGQGNVELGRWYEIVGVVETMPAAAGDAASPPILYHAAVAGDVYPASLSVRVRGLSPPAFTNRLRTIAAQIDPTLQLRGLSTTEDAIQRERGLMRLLGVTLAVVMTSVLVLSAAGIHALMSFTVARRRKEIGIRTALGADPRHILTGIFSRAFGQLAVGAALGMAAAVGLDRLTGDEVLLGRGALVLPAVALFVTAVGLLAALGPARQGLRIQPTDALREE